jgi:hypothetical protein
MFRCKLSIWVGTLTQTLQDAAQDGILHCANIKPGSTRLIMAEGMNAFCPRCATAFPGSRSIRYICFLCKDEVCRNCSAAQSFTHVDDDRQPRGLHFCCNDCHHRKLNFKIECKTEPVSFEECAKAMVLLMADSGILDAREFIEQVNERKVHARPAKKPHAHPAKKLHARPAKKPRRQ